ncbi:putative GTP-binding protein 6 [Halocaridina rubra]|uniref:GTP-binding protein 6 n=1 Tax=Halocaridina rubra TaxID=373956 RepID=A0AAN8X1F1_HALRR
MFSFYQSCGKFGLHRASVGFRIQLKVFEHYFPKAYTSCIFSKTAVSPRVYQTSHISMAYFQNIDILYFVSRKTFGTTTLLAKKKKVKKDKAVLPQAEAENDFETAILNDPEFDNLRNEMDILSFLGSQSGRRYDMGVLVLQPWIKWGPNMKHNTTAQRMLDEAVALIATLPGIRIIHKEVVPVRSIDGKVVFGSGTLERLLSLSRSLQGISSVFISIEMLKLMQVEALEEVFGMRVMDRYSVVLSIFRHHARTKEAKLQVALAELPYIKKRIGIQREKERMMMMEREKRLRNTLNAISGNRALIRQNRTNSDIPTVAVVGYTNAGKTSLIHAITGDSRAEGKNYLFATLDVTAHGGRLPCGLEVLFIDTVGFIQDIPTDLIASFKATLEDAVFANVVVHIQDASNPDYKLQGMIVEDTLSSLPLPKDTPIITVANKIDLGTNSSDIDDNRTHMVSSTTGQGLDSLLSDIEDKVLKVTGRKYWRFALSTGSDEIRWLRNATGLVYEEVNPDNPQITEVVAVMTSQEVAAYNRRFKCRN